MILAVDSLVFPRDLVGRLTSARSTLFDIQDFFTPETCCPLNPRVGSPRICHICNLYLADIVATN
jgi:hypothetical protein